MFRDFITEKAERRFVGIGFANPNIDFLAHRISQSGTRQAVRSFGMTGRCGRRGSGG